MLLISLASWRVEVSYNKCFTVKNRSGSVMEEFAIYVYTFIGVAAMRFYYFKNTYKNYWFIVKATTEQFACAC
jgi:hypothetical protein